MKHLPLQNIPSKEKNQLLDILERRFHKNIHRHQYINWNDVLLRLEQNMVALWSLNQMENTGGEPDVIRYDAHTDKYIFCDCSAESPAARRSLCYDKEALDSRKENKPISSAIEMATEMGIKILTETEYKDLQKLEPFDTKTSSWIETPSSIRNLGGAIFGDYRYGNVFIYHNGASSYYAARGFRGLLSV